MLNNKQLNAGVWFAESNILPVLFQEFDAYVTIHMFEND